MRSLFTDLAPIIEAVDVNDRMNFCITKFFIFGSNPVI